MGGGTIYGDNDFSRNFASYFATQNFDEKFLRLIDGLDSESIRLVCRIIGRLQIQYKNGVEYTIELTDQEEERLRFLRTSFRQEKIQISPNIWFYDGVLLPEDHFEICVFVDHHGIQKFNNMDRIKNQSIIDVGAFIGDSAMILSRYTQNFVYSFEASPTNYKKLEKTITLNNKENQVIPICNGLGSKKERVFIQEDGGCSKICNCHDTSSNAIEIITLDEYVQKHNIKVGLIKVDIEGFEMEFLKGALRTIKTQKPSMIVSIYHSVEDFFGIKAFIESLNLGYRFKIFKPIDHTVSLEISLLCECE